MPKIEKDLLKVKGSDGQWHYIPAVGGGGTPTWGAVQYVEQTLTDEQKTQARKNIGAGTSSFSGSYNDLTSKPTIPTQVTIDGTLKQSGQAADAKAVGDALAEKADTTDIPNVPAWAMADEKPTYTAAEVHALPDTTVIPPPYTLPQATADALGGIKADAATAEDTQDVRIGADGKLRTKPGSGGSVTDEQVNTAVSAWLAEHPEATTTVADGSITPDKLSNAEYLWQIFNPTEYLAGVSYALINTNNGVVSPYGDKRYKVTPFIACDYDTYAISIPYAALGISQYDNPGIPCCYDGSHAFLGKATMSSWVKDGKTASATFTTVGGTKYIRFSTNSIDNASSWTEGHIESIVICKGGVIYPYYFVGKIAIWDKISIADSARDNTIDGKKLLDNSIEGVKFKDLSVTKDKIAEVSPESIYGCDFKNLFNKELYDLAGRVTTHYIRNGWLSNNGTLRDAGDALGSWVTLFIPCLPNTMYALYAFNDAGEITTGYFRNFISYRDKTSEKVIEAVAVGEPVITTPADTYYICVTLTENDQSSQQKIINRIMLVKAEEPLATYYPYMVRPHWLKTDNFADGTQIICYGDSLTQNKYPAKLESLLGVLVTDAGVGGNTIAQIYNRVGNYGTNYSIVTLMVGTNDNGGQTSCPLGTIDDEAATDDNATDTSTTYVARLKRLINKIKTTHPGATYVIMPPFEHTWSNFSGLADMMRQVAELHSIPFLDIFHLCGFRGTDTTDAALYLSDGTHENDLGAQRIAELLAGFIKQLKGA